MNDSTAYRTLVDAETVRLHLDDPAWRIVDCRHDLAKPRSGAEAYAQSHLPGAVFAHLDDDLSGPRTAGSGRHPLPARAKLAQRFREWGIGRGTQIVVYDASGGSYAARLWWLARWLGHDRVALLDGGLQAWQQHGFPVSAQPPQPPRGDFEAGTSLEPTVDADTAGRIGRDPGRLLLDARAPDRYAGLNETIDPAGGHIPGAINRFWQTNLGADGRFKPAAALRAEFDALLAGRSAAQTAVYCGSGVTACHDLLALSHAGLAGAALYPDSWSGWITDPRREVATGSTP
jgi:thiosulfate/3-mercaptopyruvate sulfurtransferase